MYSIKQGSRFDRIGKENSSFVKIWSYVSATKKEIICIFDGEMDE